MNPPTYQLELRPLPDKSDPQGIRRLRILLKRLLRSHRMRCVAIRPANGNRQCNSDEGNPSFPAQNPTPAAD
jgi:hypothetical protein